MAENLNDTRPVESKTIRLTRPSVVVLCGPAGSGKSTFAASHFRPTQIISSDQCRALVCDDESDQRFQASAFAVLHSIVEQRLLINRLCVVDSTAITSQLRRTLIDLARRHSVPCTAVVFDVPLETCVSRDQARERSQGRFVGRQVIERQYLAFTGARAAIRQEGFEQVIELADDEQGRVQFEILFRPVPGTTIGAVPHGDLRRPVRTEARPGVVSRRVVPTSAPPTLSASPKTAPANRAAEQSNRQPTKPAPSGQTAVPDSGGTAR